MGAKVAGPDDRGANVGERKAGLMVEADAMFNQGHSGGEPGLEFLSAQFQVQGQPLRWQVGAQERAAKEVDDIVQGAGRGLEEDPRMNGDSAEVGCSGEDKAKQEWCLGSPGKFQDSEVVQHLRRSDEA